MDLSNLAVIIAAAACSPNPDERKAAEQSLDQVIVIRTKIDLIRLWSAIFSRKIDQSV